MHRIAAAATLLVGLAACGAPDDQPAAGDEAPGAPAPAPGTSVPAAGSDTIRVTLSEWAVRPARDTLRAGTVLFEAVNEGQQVHILEVEGQGMEEETDTIPAGGRATLEVELEPGEYELYCPIEGEAGSHEALGMTTRIVVR